MPSALSAASASGVVALIGSAMAMMPASLPVDADEDRRGAVRAQLVGLLGERRRVDAVLGQERGIAEHDLPALDRAERALAGRASRSRSTGAVARPRSSAAATMATASGCSLARSRLAASRSSLVLGEARGRHDRGHSRLALGQRAGLVDDQRVDLLHALQRLGVLDQHARLGAAPDADHDRHRRGEPERARAGDDQHRDGRDQAVGEARLGSPDRPGGEGQQRDAITAGTNQPDTWSASRWIGARLRWASRDHLHDLRQHRVAADLLAPR